MDIKKIKSIIEALLFVSGDAISLKQLSNTIGIDEPTVKRIVQQMMDSFNEEQRGIQIIEFNNKYQLSTKPECFEYIDNFIKPNKKQGLSQPSLETLSIIAYRQPITKAEIDSIRGVRSDGCITRLIERNLICESGRQDTPGKPILFCTTENFLKLFGLRSLEELPGINGFEE